MLSLCGILIACQNAAPPPDLATRSPSLPATNSPQAISPSPTPRSTSTPDPTSTAAPTPAPTSSLAAQPLTCLTEGGQIERHLLYTDLSAWPWEFRIYLPPCYAQLPDRRYPTLILIHGSTYTDAQWDQLGADETADALIAGGEIDPMIIIMPRDRVWREPADDPFGEALTDHILPWVDTHYRTLSDRQYRAIGGLSRGAAWAVHLGISRWDLFGSIGAHSLPVFWSDTYRLRGWLGEIPPDSMPRIYLDIGERDYLIESAIWFEDLLNELDIPHEWYLYPGRHEESYWASHMERYLRWYAKEW